MKKMEQFGDILASVQRNDIGLQAISSDLIFKKMLEKCIQKKEVKGKGKIRSWKARVSMRLLASLFLSLRNQNQAVMRRSSLNERILKAWRKQ